MDDAEKIVVNVSEQERTSALEQAGPTLFRLVRLFSRYPLRDHLGQVTGQPVELSRILVTEAIATEALASNQEITVGTIARRLDIDPSTASRLVTETINTGYVARQPSLIDNRRVRLELTTSGQELVIQAQKYQQAVFDDLTQDWSHSEREELARLLLKLVVSTQEKREQNIPPTPTSSHHLDQL